MKKNKKLETVDIDTLKKKFALNVSQASIVFGVGQHKIRELSEIPNNPFTLRVGRKILIKQNAFENYLDTRTNL